MTLEQKIENLLRPPLEDLGLRIIRVQIHGAKTKVLEMLIEHSDGSSVTIDDCARASRESATHLEIEDMIAGAYRLEVSSPGIDRPLFTIEDYTRFKGSKVKLETYVPISDTKKFEGVIKETSDTGVTINIGEQDLEFDLTDIRKAKLVPTYDFKKREKR